MRITIKVLLFSTDIIESSEVSDLQLDSLNDTTLLISWGEPASPNGNILSYSINITNLKDGSTVRSENREPTDNPSFTENDLGHNKILIMHLY